MSIQPQQAIPPKLFDSKPSAPRADRAARIKCWTDIAQNIVTVAAILAGGIWFLLQRSNAPQLRLDQTVSQRLLSGSTDTWLIAVDVRATNVGKVRISLAGGVMQLRQINPIPGGIIKEEKLQDLVLEPGETDQAWFRTYQVPNTIKTLQVRSDYAVPGSQRLHWNLLSAVDIGSPSTAKEAASTGP